MSKILKKSKKIEFSKIDSVSVFKIANAILMLITSLEALKVDICSEKRCLKILKKFQKNVKNFENSTNNDNLKFDN